jgi:hypothetical protein
MRNRLLGIAFALAIAFTCWLPLFAQDKKPSKPAKTPHTGQTPDFSGVWMQDRPPATADQYWIYKFSDVEPPMTAWGEAQYKAAKSSFGAHSYPLA